MISLAEVRAHLRTPVADDAQLEALRLAVLADFESRTGRLWTEREDYEQTFRIDPMDRFDPIRVKLTPVSEIAIEEKALGDASWTARASDTYFVSDDGCVEGIGAAWNQLVRVTMTGGYATAPVDVKQALLTQMHFQLRRTTSEKIDMERHGISSPAGGSTTTLLDPDMHPLYASACKRYRRHTV